MLPENARHAPRSWIRALLIINQQGVIYRALLGVFGRSFGRKCINR